MGVEVAVAELVTDGVTVTVFVTDAVGLGVWELVTDGVIVTVFVTVPVGVRVGEAGRGV